MKKAQASLFIALGLLIVIALGFLMYYKSITTEPGNNQPSVVPVDEYMTECLANKAREVSLAMAMGGGTFSPDEAISYNNRSYTTWSYYENGFGIKNKVLTRESMEKEFAAAIDMTSCTLESFEKQGYKVQAGATNAEAIITDDAISVTLSYPLTFSRGNDVRVYDTFITKIVFV